MKINHLWTSLFCFKLARMGVPGTSYECWPRVRESSFNYISAIGVYAISHYSLQALAMA